MRILYNVTMTKNTLLRKRYQKFARVKNKVSRIIAHFEWFMPEMIFRTTKLEGEQVTRKLVRAIF
jgi:hypothetical protein